MKLNIEGIEIELASQDVYWLSDFFAGKIGVLAEEIGELSGGGECNLIEVSKKAKQLVEVAAVRSRLLPPIVAEARILLGDALTMEAEAHDSLGLHGIITTEQVNEWVRTKLPTLSPSVSFKIDGLKTIQDLGLYTLTGELCGHELTVKLWVVPTAPGN